MRKLWTGTLLILLLAATAGTVEVGRDLEAAALAPVARWAASVTGRTEPAPPTAVPDLNFDRSADRVLTLGKRSTTDGRLVVSECGTALCFRLFRPEVLAGDGLPFLVNDGFLLGTADGPYDLDEFLPTSASDGPLLSSTICDAFATTPRGRRYNVADDQNPYTCGAQDDRDCYDVSVVVAVGSGHDFELWSRTVTVEVSHPKTASAAITDVTFTGTAKMSPVVSEPIPTVNPPAFQLDFMETPNVSGDGRLLVLNGGQAGIVYSLAEDDVPCDDSAWEEFHPISSLYDDQDAAVYGISEFPLRDTEGNEYDAGDIVRGSYPWLDRSGNNLFLNQVAAVNPAPGVGGWDFSLPAATVSGLTCLEASYIEARVPRKNDQAGLSFFGLWSRGKLIHLDGRANLSSYVLSFNYLDKQVDDDFCTGTPVCPLDDEIADPCAAAEADAALARDNGLEIDVFTSGGPITLNEARNTQLFSNENHFNYLPYMLPMTASDVTWVLNTSRNSMEIAFDDFVSPRMLIHSDMVPTITAPSTVFLEHNLPIFNDGFEVDLPDPGDPGYDEIQDRVVLGYNLTPRVQNAAVATAAIAPAGILPPAHGTLEGGARIEPIAAGGFEGRGVYLDGDDDRIHYDLAAAGIGGIDDEPPWYIGMWISPDGLTDEQQAPFQRLLLTLSDGTKVKIKGYDTVRVRMGGTTTNQVAGIPSGLEMSPQLWTHLGLQSEPIDEDDTRVTLYLNGYPIHRWDPFPGDDALFRLGAGDVYVGADADNLNDPAYLGWVDEVKVVQGVLNPEEACNQAGGTLVGVDSTSHPIASLFPDAFHAEVDATADPGTLWQEYYCEIHYPEVDALSVSSDRPFAGGGETQVCIGHLGHSPPAACVGRAFNFPEGPLFFDEVRPDSLANAFCLACHTAADTRVTMDPGEVLDEGTVDTRFDPRRQPNQPPQRVFGLLPSHFSSGYPHANPTADEHWIDCLVLDGSALTCP